MKDKKNSKDSKELQKVLGYTVVHVQVGDGLKDFGIHKDLICHHSPYFRAAFNSGFEETTIGIMKLPETDANVFELFYHWLYTQKLVLPPCDEAKANAGKNCKLCKDQQEIDTDDDDTDDDDADDNNTDEPIPQHDDACILQEFSQKEIKHLVMLYIFANMAQIPVLQNLCIKTFYEATETYDMVAVDEVEYIWEHTTSTSLLRKIMVDMLTWEYDPSNYIHYPDYLPTFLKDEVLFAMGKRLRRAEIGGDIWDSPLDDITNYYVKVEQ